MSRLANCLRIANINSCLRMIEAFSTSCFSAKASSSVGDFSFKSCSLISCIGRKSLEGWRGSGRAEKGGRLAQPGPAMTGANAGSDAREQRQNMSVHTRGAVQLDLFEGFDKQNDFRGVRRFGFSAVSITATTSATGQSLSVMPA